jgi:hypothetical protein
MDPKPELGKKVAARAKAKTRSQAAKTSLQNKSADLKGVQRPVEGLVGSDI